MRVHPDLIKFTKESTSPEPIITTLTSVHDVKAWLSPSLTPFSGHSTPHCFKIIQDETGEVKLYYKCWSSDPWCSNDEALIPLKVSTSNRDPNNLHAYLALTGYENNRQLASQQNY